MFVEPEFCEGGTRTVQRFRHEGFAVKKAESWRSPQMLKVIKRSKRALDDL